MKNKTNINTIIIQTIIYKITDNQLLFLLLKRSEDRGGFWNAVNGTQELYESIEECKKRELLEETGIEEVLFWGPELYSFNFDFKEKKIRVIVFCAQILEDQKIIINKEHREFRWVDFIEAKKLLKFDDDKKSLEICNKFVKNNK